MKKLFILSIITLCFSRSQAQLHLPRIFGDNMVLQREVPIPVWGTASQAGAEISVTIDSKTLVCTADSLGNWKLSLGSMHAGGPYELTMAESISGKVVSEKTFKNVMIGEVWLASGQSNMELKLRESTNGKEEAAAALHPNIRFFQVPHDIETEPRHDIRSGDWQICDSSTAGNFSAVAYYFAKQIHHEKDVPVGVLESTWGGSPVEAWTSSPVLETVPECREKIQKNRAMNINEASFLQDKEDEKRFFDIIFNSLNGEKLHFPDTSFDDAAWDTIVLPETFRKDATYQDILWFRKTVDIPATMTGADLRVNLGYPEILYSMYFNGTRICQNSWNAQKKHIYNIPVNIVKAGKNVITLRICAMWNGGGVDDPADSMYVTNGKERVPLSGSWRYLSHAETELPRIKYYHKYPSYLFNGMINPVIPFALKGFLWYQGEENAACPGSYATLFPLLISDWRNRWQQGNVPFVYVQLPNYMKRVDKPAESDWALLREAQAKTLSVPNTAMAVTIDLGQADDIHPKDKKDVASRLALAANHVAYHEENIYSGPRFEKQSPDGKRIKIVLNLGGSAGIEIHGDTLKGFDVAGADKVFHRARATISGNCVTVWCDEVTKPVAVRYGWADNPDCNLYNKEGLPAVPFRTDSW